MNKKITAQYKLNPIYIITLLILLSGSLKCQSGPYQANGIKIGEVSQNTAIIWTRLTKNAERKIDGIPFKFIGGKKSHDNPKHYVYKEPQIPEGHTLGEMQNVVPGAQGQVRVQYWILGQKEKTFKTTSWESVNSDKDFTHQFTLTDLKPWTSYELITECRSSDTIPVNMVGMIKGHFKTPQDPQLLSH